MAEILPKDHQATVDEVVKLFSTNPPSISLETSQKILGRGVGEVDRIMEMISNDEIMETRNPTAGNDVQEAQAGKMTPQTSNN